MYLMGLEKWSPTQEPRQRQLAEERPLRGTRGTGTETGTRLGPAPARPQEPLGAASQPTTALRMRLAPFIPPESAARALAPPFPLGANDRAGREAWPGREAAARGAGGVSSMGPRARRQVRAGRARGREGRGCHGDGGGGGKGGGGVKLLP